MANSSVNSVRLAIEILKCLAENKNRVTDISISLGISKSTAHRLLKTLQSTGMVTQNTQGRTYHLGKLLVQLAYPLVTSHQILIECAKAQMQHLRELSGETIILYVKQGKDILCVEELPSTHRIKYTFGKGNTMPWHVGAASKVILAQLPGAEIEKILKNIEIVKYTDKTYTDPETIRKNIQEVRARGYATSFGTYELDTAALSVPITNYVTPAALSILGADKDFGPRLPEIIAPAIESAAVISHKLAQEFK